MTWPKLGKKGVIVKYLIKRGLIDVWNLLLTLMISVVGLTIIYVLTSEMAAFLSFVLSIKATYFVGVLFLGCLARFVVSVLMNFRRAKEVVNTGEYSFEDAAEIIGRNANAFDVMDQDS